MDNEAKILNYSKVGKEKINRSLLLDILLSIRLSLSLKRITSPTIKRDELRNLVNDNKAEKDKAVNDAIDDVFEKYLDRPKE